MPISRRLSLGFSLLSLLVVIVITGAMGAAMSVMMATNQSTRTQQLRMDQAFYCAHAALEFTERQVRVDGNPSRIPARDFMGTAFSITRSGGKVNITTTQGSATNTFSATDPGFSQGSCLTVDASSANKSGLRLNGVNLNRTPGCGIAVSITSMIVSWSPTGGNTMERIRLSGAFYYNSTGLVSGSTFPFSSTFTIADSNIYNLNYLEWTNTITATSFTLIFNMADGTTQTATFSA